MGLMVFLFLSIFVDGLVLERGGWGRREGHQCIVPRTYTLVGWFLYVSSPGTPGWGPLSHGWSCPPGEGVYRKHLCPSHPNRTPSGSGCAGPEYLLSPQEELRILVSPRRHQFPPRIHLEFRIQQLPSRPTSSGGPQGCPSAQPQDVESQPPKVYKAHSPARMLPPQTLQRATRPKQLLCDPRPPPSLANAVERPFMPGFWHASPRKG